MPELETKTVLDQNTGLYYCQGTWKGNLFTGNGLTEETAVNAATRSFSEWILVTYPNPNQRPA